MNMYADEKSDEGIRAEKRPNKGGSPPAEAVLELPELTTVRLDEAKVTDFFKLPLNDVVEIGRGVAI
jgi:hypothetical protein